LQAIADEAQAQAASLRIALHARQPEVLQTNKDPLERGQLKKAKKELSQTRREIARLGSVHAQEKIEREQQLSELRILKSTNEHLESDLAETKSQLNELITKSELSKAIPGPAQLPLEVFGGIRFDGELTCAIQKVLANSTLPPTSKMQVALKAITSHYNRKIEQFETSLNKTSREHYELLSNFNQFVMDLTIALNDKPATAEAVHNDRFLKQLVQGVVELRHTADNLKHEFGSLNAIITHFCEVFGNDRVDPIKTIDEIKNVIVEQRSIITQKSKDVKALKRENTQLTKTLSQTQIDHSVRLTELTQNFETISHDLETVTSIAKSLEAQNETLQTELNETKRSLRRVQSVTSESHVVERSPPDSPQIHSLQRDFADLQRKYNKLLEQLKTEQEKARELDHKQRLEITSLQQEIKDQKVAVSRAADSVNARIETEKSELKTAYELVIASLRKDLATQRDDIEKLSRLFQEADAKSTALEHSNERLTKRCQKTALEVQSLKAASAKEKQLAELSIVANRVAIESEFNQRLDEMKTRTQSEKRRLYTLAAESFRAFFNPTEEIDERSFRVVVNRAREELERLTASDQTVRRLVEATENQTTEDAVARIVIGL
jgi:hypothetical protein